MHELTQIVEGWGMSLRLVVYACESCRHNTRCDHPVRKPTISRQCHYGPVCTCHSMCCDARACVSCQYLQYHVYVTTATHDPHVTARAVTHGLVPIVDGWGMALRLVVRDGGSGRHSTRCDSPAYKPKLPRPYHHPSMYHMGQHARVTACVVTHTHVRHASEYHVMYMRAYQLLTHMSQHVL
eukprot:862972-Pyramimonas_sp.AAC.2